MYRNKFTDKKGFTLIELMVSLAIVGILAATSIPVMRAYALKAQQLELELTIKHLMDGMETFYLDTNKLYPVATTSIIKIITVEKGEGKIIPELSYTFPPGHKHTYEFYHVDLSSFGSPDYAWFNVLADFDYDRDGENDYYRVYMYVKNGKPYVNDEGDTLYRYIRPPLEQLDLK